jgi:regulator of replication initiation timing
MKDQEHDLTSFEIRELSNFQIYMVNSPEENDYSDFEEDRMKRRLKQIEKRTRKNRKGTFEDLSYISATSDIVERLFSTRKHILSDERKSMDPDSFNETLFLKVHHEKWDIFTMEKVYK